MGAQGFAERARRELIATGEKVRKQQLASGDELTRKRHRSRALPPTV